ncbi:MAG: DNA translocase FtsK 4TM domain-containing protein [Candidatus Kerfeldbacteria bacterium]|nr:DNA translocase FtsK 4TM domain-containing protein [Candidatus Kerfeldbacteria bacterium]
MSKSGMQESRNERRATSASRKRSDGESAKRPEPLNPETRHGITVVVLFTVAAICALSLFNLAGPLGAQINQGLTLLLGGFRFLVPVGFIAVGYLLLFPDRYPLRSSFYVGLSLLVLSGTALLHLTVPLAEAVDAIAAGEGGGYVGLLLSYPLRAVVGSLAATVVLIAVLIIALLVTFNTTLTALAARGNVVGSWYGTLRSWWYRLRYRLTERQQSLDAEEEEAESTKAESLDTPTTFDQRPVAAASPAVAEGTQTKLFEPPPRKHRKIEIPPDLLDRTPSKASLSQIEDKKEHIRKTLENFGISVEMGAVNVGPTVTQFTLKPADGVKLSQITALHNDLALALAAHPIRIEAPIPGMSLVGIEVPNESVAIVNLRDIIESEPFKKRKSNLTFTLGKDVAGLPWVANLDPMPHLLIAGATGSGKSVMLNSLIISLLYVNSPDDLKLIMVDPKRVEFTVYNDVPHLLTPVITETTKTVNALRWIVGEMDRRFQVLSSSGQRNIQGYHREVDDGMPYIVVIIDELADLMSVAAQEVEGAIIRLAQMARAVGIHLVVATQRPSVNVITGLIKANITSRIAFNVASAVDSRTILDMSGAEKLLGKGDMLFVSSELSKPKRLQAAYVSDNEIQRVTQFLKDQATPDYVPSVTEKPMVEASRVGLEELGEDELLGEAKDLILRSGKASASFLQRRLRVGYARAARLLDLLEERGIIGPGEGAKPREILISRAGYVGIDEPDDGDGVNGQAVEPDLGSDESSDDERLGR